MKNGVVVLSVTLCIALITVVVGVSELAMIAVIGAGWAILLVMYSHDLESLIASGVIALITAISAHLFVPFRTVPIVEVPLIACLVWMCCLVAWNALFSSRRRTGQ